MSFELISFDKASKAFSVKKRVCKMNREIQTSLERLHTKGQMLYINVTEMQTNLPYIITKSRQASNSPCKIPPNF